MCSSQQQNPLQQFLYDSTPGFTSYAEWREVMVVVENFTHLLIGTGWERGLGVVRLQVPLFRVNYATRQEIEIGGMVYGEGSEPFLVSQFLVEKAIEQIAASLGVRFAFHLRRYHEKWKAAVEIEGSEAGIGISRFSTLALMRATLAAVDKHRADQAANPVTHNHTKDIAHENHASH